MTDYGPPPSSVPKPPPRRRWWRLLLIASLSLNLLFVGLVAGGAMRLWRGPPPGMAMPASETALLWRALPDGERRALRGPESATAPRGPARAAQLRDEFENLRALLLAEPFDRAALEARLSEAHARGAEQGARALAGMLDRIEAMDAEARAGMVGRMEQRLEHGAGRR